MSQIKRVLSFFLLLFAQSLMAQQTVTLKVVIDSIQSLKGNILVAVYNNKGEYKNSKAFQLKKTKVSGSMVTTTFKLPTNTNYAIALFQDINQNDTLDTKGSMKIPTEPFGFSNNKKGTFGPPGFDKIMFTMTADTTITVHLISSRKSYLQKEN